MRTLKTLYYQMGSTMKSTYPHIILFKGFLNVMPYSYIAVLEAYLEPYKHLGSTFSRRYPTAFSY